MWTLTFWKDAAERAVSTFAQTLIAMVGTDAVLEKVTLGWKDLLLTAAIAGGLSILKSVAATRVGTKGTASFAKGVGMIVAVAAALTLLTASAGAHETTGVPDYSIAGQSLLNDHRCLEDEYKFIPASGNRVRCVAKDGGFPRLAPHE